MAIRNVTRSKKILLFGGSGFVGSAIAEELRNFHTIIAPTHRDLNLTDFFSLKKNINQSNPDIILYASGLASVDRCEEEVELANILNTKVPEIIASEANILKIPLYYISTDAVFRGNRKNYSYTEEDTVDPFSVYGKTKLAGEEVVLGHSSKNAIIRIICPFRSFYLQKTDFARLAIEKLSKKESFPGIIDQTMNPLYIDYLTKALSKLIYAQARGIYHLGATDCDTNFNIIKRLAQMLDLDVSLITPITLEAFLKNKRALRSQYSCLNVSKFQKEFGEEILQNLDISLRDFIKGKH